MHALLNILAATIDDDRSLPRSRPSSTYTLLFIVLVFGAVYFLFIRPRQQRMRQQQTQARQLSVGDEVVSAGGIYGRVVAMDTDVAEVEVAPGVVMTFLRRAISARPGAPPRPRAGPPSEAAPARRPQREQRHRAGRRAWSPEQDAAPTPGDDEGPATRPTTALTCAAVWSGVWSSSSASPSIAFGATLASGRTPAAGPGPQGRGLRGPAAAGHGEPRRARRGGVDHRAPGQRARRRQLRRGPPGQRRGDQPARDQGRPGRPQGSGRDGHPVLPAGVLPDPRLRGPGAAGTPRPTTARPRASPTTGPPPRPRPRRQGAGIARRRTSA